MNTPNSQSCRGVSMSGMLQRLCRRLCALLIPGSHLPLNVAALPHPSRQSRADDLQLHTISRRFSRELFARLIMELPAYRASMQRALAEHDDRRLRDCVHQLLGVTAYCDAAELESALRALHSALERHDADEIACRLRETLGIMDSLQRGAGYAGA